MTVEVDSPPGAAGPVIAFGPFTFDRGNGLLRHGSREVALPPRALGVLDLLVSRPGTIVPKQELIETVWKDAFVTDTSLAEAISVLRQTLGDDSQAPQFIQTVHRRGYRFVAPLSTIEAAAKSTPDDRSHRGPADFDRSPSIGHQLVPWAFASLSLILAVIAVWQYTTSRPALPPVVRMRIEPAAGTVFEPRAPALALSPDGLTLAWSACSAVCHLYIRPLDQLDPRRVAGTEGASAPFFSYDGRWVGFFASGKLQKVALAGGMPVVLTDAPQAFGAVWLPDGRIVFAASERGGLMRVSDSGGNAEILTQPSADAGEVRHCWPALAPGERALMFTVATAPHDEAAGRIALMRIDTNTEWRTLIDNADTAQAVSPDYLAFSRGHEIHAVAFDRTRQTVAGADQTVITGAARAQFAVARSGAVAYALAPEAAPAALTWIPSGPPFSTELAALRDLTVTSDGTRVAGVSGSDIWVGDINRGTTTRLTHGGTNVEPVWNGHGSAVYYSTASGGPFEIWTRDSGGSSPAQQVLSAARRHKHVFPSSVSRDGRLLAYTESGGPTRGDVKVIDTVTAAVMAAVETPFDETNGALSPDGRLLAYQSDESGRWEISLLKLGEQRRIPISSAGGQAPLWSPSGNALFYTAGDRSMRIAINTEGEPVGAPVAAAAGGSLTGIVTGDRILVRGADEQPSAHAVVTLEWRRDLHRILGPPASPLPR